MFIFFLKYLYEISKGKGKGFFLSSHTAGAVLVRGSEAVGFWGLDFGIL